jgi:prepilin-type N-terminal cleavage/methylation domain-containing protein
MKTRERSLHRNLSHSYRGFTIIEIAVVLVIITILLGILLPSIGARIDAARVAATKTKIENIKSSILAFIAKNGRLPCPAIEGLAPPPPAGPDNGYGREATPKGACTGTAALTTGVVRGVVPWRDLSLSDDDALDGHFRRFTYAVVTSETNLTVARLPGIVGTIALHSGTPVAPGNQLNINNLAVFVVVSYGSNGFGAYSSEGIRQALPVGDDELANTDTGDIAFVQKDFSNAYDDVVVGVSAREILTSLLPSAIKPPAGALNDSFQAIKAAIIGYVVRDNADPDAAGARTRARRLPAPLPPNAGLPTSVLGLPAELGIDPWGNPLKYEIGTELGATSSIGGIYSGTAASVSVAFRLTSGGPNGALNATDDIVFSMSVNELLGVLAAAGVPID